MADPIPLVDFDQMQRRLAAIQAREPKAPLETSGGGGDSTGMEARVAKLEAHMEHVRADLTVLKTDAGTVKTGIATLTERISHLPSKGFVVTATVTALALLGALTLFAPNLQRLIGVQ